MWTSKNRGRYDRSKLRYPKRDPICQSSAISFNFDALKI
jgi:hypothetical protein